MFTVLFGLFMTGLLMMFIIWFIFYMFERFGEYLNDCKTKRRYYDFENIYFDYHHHTWVNKYVPVETSTIIIEG